MFIYISLLLEKESLSLIKTMFQHSFSTIDTERQEMNNFENQQSKRDEQLLKHEALVMGEEIRQIQVAQSRIEKKWPQLAPEFTKLRELWSAKFKTLQLLHQKQLLLSDKKRELSFHQNIYQIEKKTKHGFDEKLEQKKKQNQLEFEQKLQNYKQNLRLENQKKLEKATKEIRQSCQQYYKKEQTSLILHFDRQLDQLIKSNKNLIKDSKELIQQRREVNNLNKELQKTVQQQQRAITRLRQRLRLRGGA